MTDMVIGFSVQIVLICENKFHLFTTALKGTIE